MKTTGVGRAGRWVAGIAIASALTLGRTPAGEPQYRFDVSEPFRIGVQLFTSGTIMVHPVLAFTPTITLVEVWVGDRCLGLVTAHHVRSEAPAARDEAFFRRDESGRLVMLGFRVADQSSGGAYRFADAEVPPAAGTSSAPAGAIAAGLLVGSD